MRTQTIRFNAMRAAMPKQVRIGFESDNLVERLEFVLPEISARQNAALLIGGRMANMVLLDRTENGRWGIDLTRELVGDADAAEAYVRIDTSDGRVWNSGVLTLVTAELPGVDTQINMQYPTAMDQFMETLLAHDANMSEQAALVNAAALDAERAKESAENSASSAATHAESAKTVFDKMCPPFELSGQSVNCHPVEGSPLHVVSEITAYQSGSGDPSPDNVRPISGYDESVLHINDEAHGIQFGETVYGGTYDWTDGILTVTHGKIVLTGTESFVSGNKPGQYYVTHGAESGMLIDVACSHLIGESGAAYNARYPDCVEVRSTRLWVYVPRFATATELKQYLAAQYAAGTPVTVIYTTSDPTERMLQGIDITASGEETVISASTGPVVVRGNSDPSWVIEQLTIRIEALEAAIVNGN